LEPIDKPSLRARLLAVRKARPADVVESASRAIAQRVLDLPEPGAVRVVALYQALPYEVSTRALWRALAARGLRTVFPRMVKGSRLLVFGAADGDDDLQPGPMGIREPRPGRDVELADIDLFFVPGVAYDRSGFRLGYGGGYYDTTLARARDDALRIGLCFDEELVERLPAEAHDAPVDAVVTEARTIRSPGRRHRA
jgi:5-formyltetrahydrofolate cyclo-ligase